MKDTVMSKQRIQLFWHQKLPDKSIMATPLVCYKHPEYRLPNTVFFIINITPHRGDGALLTGVPRLI